MKCRVWQTLGMAFVRSFNPGAQTVTTHPTAVDCYYQTVAGGPTGLRLHLSTFGSDVRESHPKSSQPLQLDQDGAAQLIRILRETFPNIAV